MLAAFNRKSNEDMSSFINALAIKLSDAVNGVEIKRAKDSLFSKNTHIESITIPFSSCKYILEIKNKTVVGKCSKESGGIVLKTDILNLNDWLANLMSELEKTTDQNMNAAETIHKFLME
jgi:hypothetical protein